jgi:hypothetical protein
VLTVAVEVVDGDHLRAPSRRMRRADEGARTPLLSRTASWWGCSHGVPSPWSGRWPAHI